jgi:hypothetical protein
VPTCLSVRVFLILHVYVHVLAFWVVAYAVPPGLSRRALIAAATLPAGVSSAAMLLLAECYCVLPLCRPDNIIR